MKLKKMGLIIVIFFTILQGCTTPSQDTTGLPKLHGTVYLSNQADLRPDKRVKSSIVLINSGEPVMIIDNSDKVFYKVKYNEYIGYVSRNFLTPTKPKSTRYSPTSTLTSPSSTPNSPSKTSTSPSSTQRNTVKKTNCGSVQCSGTTKKGARCRNTTTSCSGRCHLH